MTAPNVVNVSTITAKTTYLTPSDTSANVLLANAIDSGKVFKINTIIACNVDGTANYSATIAINTAAAGSGTSFPIVSTVSIPNDATLVASDKNSAIYLEEDKSIVVTSSTASKITYIVSYEEIS